MIWQIDSTHSQVMFSVRHMMVSTIKGHFNVFSGTLDIDEHHPENSWIEAEVDAASIDTRDEKRNGHLRSPDFFDVQTYPTITFKSTKIEAVSNQTFRVTGNWTMHGVTKEVTFDADYSGQIKDIFGLQRAGLSTAMIINRKDWGLNWSQALETGGLLVGDTVKIDIDLEVTQKAP